MKEYVAEYIVPVEKKGNDRMLDFMNAKPLIRCKNCAHRDKETTMCRGRGWPMQLVPDEDYCSKAEPKDKP